MSKTQSDYSDRIEQLTSLAKSMTMPLHFIRRIKQKAIDAQDYGKAAIYRDVERRLLAEAR